MDVAKARSAKVLKRVIAATTALGIVTAGLVVILTASAANVHYKNSPPLTFTDLGTRLSASGALTGLGNGDVLVNLTANAIPTTTCTNQGGNQAPGQNPGAVTVTGSQAIPASAVKNGNVVFGVTTQPPAQPTARQAGCPSPNWTAAIIDLRFTSATLRFFQAGQLVLQTTCTFSGNNGTFRVVSCI
jgi:hypothetical protein